MKNPKHPQDQTVIINRLEIQVRKGYLEFWRDRLHAFIQGIYSNAIPKFTWTSPQLIPNLTLIEPTLDRTQNLTKIFSDQQRVAILLYRNMNYLHLLHSVFMKLTSFGPIGDKISSIMWSYVRITWRLCLSGIRLRIVLFIQNYLDCYAKCIFAFIVLILVIYSRPIYIHWNIDQYFSSWYSLNLTVRIAQPETWNYLNFSHEVTGPAFPIVIDLEPRIYCHYHSLTFTVRLYVIPVVYYVIFLV